MRRSHIVWLTLLAVTLAVAGCSHVSEDWKSAQAADTTEAYQDFLRQHPDSEFGVSAQERIKQLAEERDWKQASTADTLDAYQQFIAAHADGKWAQEARVRIENFQLNAASPGTAPAAAGAPVAAAASGKPAAATHAPPAARAAKTQGSHAAKSAAHGHYTDQLGAFQTRASAKTAWLRLAKKFPSEFKSLHPHYAVTLGASKSLIRLQVSVTSSQQAHELCAVLRKKSQACVTLR